MYIFIEYKSNIFHHVEKEGKNQSSNDWWYFYQWIIPFHTPANSSPSGVFLPLCSKTPPNPPVSLACSCTPSLFLWYWAVCVDAARKLSTPVWPKTCREPQTAGGQTSGRRTKWRRASWRLSSSDHFAICYFIVWEIRHKILRIDHSLNFLMSLKMDLLVSCICCSLLLSCSPSLQRLSIMLV